MRREHGSERGGIISFLMFAVVVVVAGAASRSGGSSCARDAAPPPKIEDTNVVGRAAPLDGDLDRRPRRSSFVQYRVKEQFAGAVIETDATGRTNDVTAIDDDQRHDRLGRRR